MEKIKAQQNIPTNPSNPSPSTTSHPRKFPTYKAGDDTEAFLENFERACLGYNLSTDQYMVELRPQLSGPLAEVAAEMPKEHMNKYELFKSKNQLIHSLAPGQKAVCEGQGEIEHSTQSCAGNLLRYSQQGSKGGGHLISLSKQCDLPTRKVERWFRYRRNQDKPSLTTKFCEASWRFTFYFISFFTGFAVLYDPLLLSVFWYYMLELSFYSSLVCTLPFDVKRKDLNQQIVHHVATIFLICFSYCANYLRIGTLVMVIHDASDCILEPTKIFNYMKWR
ncbi:unnamed protein product [Eretmochelys imbricata]